MKFSLKTAQEFSNVDLAPNGVEALVETIGLQLGAVENVIDFGQKYQRIVVAKIMKCDKHPNADKLSVCRLDDGGITPDVKRGAEGLIDVVCGAPNVAAGQSVAWIPPGASVPASFDTAEPFVLDAKELRGVVSNGMIASAKELALGDDHDGILVLEGDFKPGTPLSEALDLNDTVIDLENKMFTHRPDCFGVIGIARELAGIQGRQYTDPDWYKRSDPLHGVKYTESVAVNVRVETERVPRLSAIAFDNLSVKQSPMWLKIALIKAGMKPVNNIVDITNYAMYVTGQPLHAYDYDKLVNQQSANSKEQTGVDLTARMSHRGEKLTLLGGKQIDFDDEQTIVIASGGTVVGLGGVMGGADTEVDDTTSRIVLECAAFDMYAIRRASMKYGLFTEAVTRFNKGQSPLQVNAALRYAHQLLAEHADGRAASAFQDSISEPDEIAPPVVTTPQFINARLGSSLNKDEIMQLLRSVQFAILDEGDQLEIHIPFWRMDIEIAEDIVEEVGRLYGFHRLPIELPIRRARPAARNSQLDLEQDIRETLAAAGANEVLTYSFVHGDLLRKSGQDADEAYKLRNALSPELQYYRLSLTPSLLDRVRPNLKAGYGQFAVFEINPVHSRLHPDELEPALPQEDTHLSLVVAADDKTGRIQSSGAGFYQARVYLTELLNGFGLDAAYRTVSDDPDATNQPFEPGRSAYIEVTGVRLGIIGEFKTGVRSGLKLPRYCAGFELNLRELKSLLDQIRPARYEPISRYPSITSDLTLAVGSDVPHQDIWQAVRSTGSDYEIRSVAEQIDIFQKSGDSVRHHTFRVKMWRMDRTMTQDEANNFIDAIASAAAEKVAAKRV